MRAALLFPLLCFSLLAAGEDQRPGYGVVQSVTPVVKAQPSASAGASAPASPHGPIGYRVRVRLDDGTIQFRVVKKPAFAPGERVLLTNAGDVVAE